MSTGLSKNEEMALMKKLGALELENKELKKGKICLRHRLDSISASIFFQSPMT